MFGLRDMALEETRPFCWRWLSKAQVFLVAKMVKNLPAMQETLVSSLEEGMAFHSSILAWRTP